MASLIEMSKIEQFHVLLARIVATDATTAQPTVHEIHALCGGDIAVNRLSAAYSTAFAKKIMQSYAMSPEVDVDANGTVFLTWRSPQGIINIAFWDDGLATYAAYFPLLGTTYKGRFSVVLVPPDTERNE